MARSRPPSLPLSLYQNCHCWNPYPDNISPIVQLPKRGFVSINQSLGGCQIKYRQTRVKELEIVQIYISLTFPVISPLLGRVPHRHHFHNSARDWMENIFYLNGNVENVAFQPIVFDCKRLELAGFTENITLSLSVFSMIRIYILCISMPKQKCQIYIQNYKTKSNTQSPSVVSVAAV